MSKINRKILLINELLRDTEYLNRVCCLSDNNPQIVIESIVKIISYYLLNSLDKSLNEIIRDESVMIEDMIFTPSNTRYSTRFSLFGVNLDNCLYSLIRSKMLELGYSMDMLLTFDRDDVGITLEYAVYKAMKVYPFYNLFFEKDSVTEYLVGENICDYYKRIYMNKLKKLGRVPKNKDMVLLEQLILEFENEEACVLLNRYDYFTKGKCIVLPSFWKIVEICARNKKMDKGVAINPNIVEYIEDTLGKREKYVWPVQYDKGVVYERYEMVIVDDNFRYFNVDLSGIPQVDLEILYGKNDIHNNRDIWKRSYLENIAEIKKKNDILLNYCGGVYQISNGRHRIVYMKYFYDINKCYYAGMRDSYRELFTIPVKVSHTIEDEKFNSLIRRGKGKFIVVKNSILDDEMSICIIYNNAMYFTNGLAELQEFVEMIEGGERPIKYLYSEYRVIGEINYNNILEIIYFKMGDRICNLTFKDILDMIPKEVVRIVNPIRLYEHYTSLVNNYLRNKFFNLSLMKYNIDGKRTLVDKIIYILIDRPELLKLEMEDIMNLIRKEWEYDEISDDELREIIGKFGIIDKKHKIKKYHI